MPLDNFRTIPELSTDEMNDFSLSLKIKHYMVSLNDLNLYNLLKLHA